MRRVPRTATGKVRRDLLRLAPASATRPTTQRSRGQIDDGDGRRRGARAAGGRGRLVRRAGPGAGARASRRRRRDRPRDVAADGREGLARDHGPAGARRSGPGHGRWRDSDEAPGLRRACRSPSSGRECSLPWCCQPPRRTMPSRRFSTGELLVGVGWQFDVGGRGDARRSVLTGTSRFISSAGAERTWSPPGARRAPVCTGCPGTRRAGPGEERCADGTLSASLGLTHVNAAGAARGTRGGRGSRRRPRHGADRRGGGTCGNRGAGARHDHGIPARATAVRQADRLVPGASAPRGGRLDAASSSRAPRSTRPIAVHADPESSHACEVGRRQQREGWRRGRRCRRYARTSLQLHGAIGFTEEHDLGLYVNRALTLAPWLGNAAEHRRRYSDLIDAGEGS